MPSQSLGSYRPKALLDSNKYEVLSSLEDDSVDAPLLDRILPPDKSDIPLKNGVLIENMLDKNFLGVEPKGSSSHQVVLRQQ